MAPWMWIVAFLVGAEGARTLQAPAPDEEAVARIRSSLMYPYSPDDYQEWITNDTPNVPLQLPFQLPYLGLAVDYASISLNGYVSFNTEAQVQFPLQFPVEKWPIVPDPTYLGPFVIPGVLGKSADPEKKAGIYLSVYSNIGGNERQDEIDLKAAVEEDIRNASFNPFFEPKHVIIITWRNITLKAFDSDTVSNSYQVIITSDEKQTYAIFNYEQMIWVGSDPKTFIGFNVGNNSGGFEYLPYSRNNQLPRILVAGQGSRFKGRHVFRIDGTHVLPFTCNLAPGSEERLYLSAVSGDIRGGDEVNVTGPCFDSGKPLNITFNQQSARCVFRSSHRASCITPALQDAGLIDVQFRNETKGTVYKAKLYSQDSLLSPKYVDVTKGQTSILLQWNPNIFSSLQRQLVNITLLGFRENEDGKVSILHVKDIAHLVQNVAGIHQIDAENIVIEDDEQLDDIQLGMIQIYPAFSNSKEPSNYKRIIWSKPLPVDWFFSKYWERRHGKDWARKFCNQWLLRNENQNDWQKSLPACPCTRQQISVDKGRFVSTAVECGSNDCGEGPKSYECYRSGQPTPAGAGQFCCYDADSELISNHDSHENAGFPSHAHPKKVHYPWLSHWTRDRLGKVACCDWLGNSSEGCQRFTQLRRSDDCSKHQPPNGATVFGDPHVITFNNLTYTFNGKGEYTLLTAHDQDNEVVIQGRFQQVLSRSKNRELNATQLTAVTIKESGSNIVEVRLPPLRQTLKFTPKSIPCIYINGEEIDPSLLTDALFTLPLHGVTLYRYYPFNIVASFPSGLGVEFVTDASPVPLAIIVYLPRSFKNSTTGLLGTWTDSKTLTPPADLHLPSVTLPASLEDIHEKFGLHWMITNEGIPDRPGSKSLFTYEFNRTSSYYTDKNFRPFMGDGIGGNMDDSSRICGGSNFQCQYDYTVTGDETLAKININHVEKFRNTTELLKEVVRCPVLTNPDHGKKDTTERTPKTKVTFSCDEGYILQGEKTRYCLFDGQWSSNTEGKTKCVPQTSTQLGY